MLPIDTSNTSNTSNAGRTLRDELDDLYARYAETLDEGPLDGWPGLFTDDASYRVVPRSNFDRGLRLATMWCEGRPMMNDRVNALRTANFVIPRRTRHVIGPLRVHDIDPAATSVRVDANFAVYETIALRPTIVLAVGCSRDVVSRCDDGRLRFAEKLVLNDSDLVPNSLALPL